jgi:hypothetical protein
LTEGFGLCQSNYASPFSRSPYQSIFIISLNRLRIGNQMPNKLRASCNDCRPVFVAASTLFLMLTLTSTALADPCVVNDPSGTVTLPPVGCEYLTGDEVHEITAGLPEGTTIVLAPIHKDFICSERAKTANCDIPMIPGVSCEEPGGDLGGNSDCFESILEFQITGTGVLSSFSRTISVTSPSVVDTGPRTIGDPVQSFDTEMVALQAELFGDPDFCVLSIRAGSDFNLPASSGHTILTDIGGNNWAVDSFFDITYEITYQGCPGSVLEGFSGTNQGTIRMQAGDPTPVTPGITGPWVILFGMSLASTAVYFVRRQRTA